MLTTTAAAIVVSILIIAMVALGICSMCRECSVPVKRSTVKRYKNKAIKPVVKRVASHWTDV